MRRFEQTLTLPEATFSVRLFGPYERYVRLLREAFSVEIYVRQERVKVMGTRPDVERAARAIEKLREIAERDGTVAEKDVRAAIGSEKPAEAEPPRPPSAPTIPRLRTVTPRSAGQEVYVKTIDANDIVFSIGPAGTGKTFLAVSAAVAALRGGRVRRIVLARPAVEAGERLGFLPGDFQAKVNPYLRPLYDALNNLLEFGQLQRLIETEIIEICPLAYMRGRTLDHAFIILDEAQNTTSDQMKMFLTRMGEGSKIVVTGDVTQTDLPAGKMSGLIEAQHLFRDIPGIAISTLSKADIVRHALVQRIVDAYETKERLLAKRKK